MADDQDVSQVIPSAQSCTRPARRPMNEERGATGPFLRSTIGVPVLDTSIVLPIEKPGSREEAHGFSIRNLLLITCSETPCSALSREPARAAHNPWNGSWR